MINLTIFQLPSPTKFNRYLQKLKLDKKVFTTKMPPVRKRVAVIGAGPSGLSAVRALSQEGTFDTIRVFERRHKIGGTWYASYFTMQLRATYKKKSFKCF